MRRRLGSGLQGVFFAQRPFENGVIARNNGVMDLFLKGHGDSREIFVGEEGKKETGRPLNRSSPETQLNWTKQARNRSLVSACSHLQLNTVAITQCFRHNQWKPHAPSFFPCSLEFTVLLVAWLAADSQGNQLGGM